MATAWGWIRRSREDKSCPRARPRRCGVGSPERLEDRRLLSTAAQVHAAAVWTVHGTRSDDVTIIDRNPAVPQDLRVFRNGMLLGQRPDSQVKAIRVITGAGNDVVRVDPTVAAIAVPLIVDAGSGNDRVIGGAGRNVLHAGSGIDTLSGPGKNVIVGGRGHAQVLNATSSSPHSLSSLRSLRAYLEESYKLQKGAGTGGRHKYSGARTPVNGTFAGAPPAAPTSGSSSTAPSHSGTNNQVQGVDEADIVQTDGNYLYILTQSDLVIVAAQPAANLAVASKTTIEGYPVAMFLDGTKLSVISQVYPDTGSSTDTLTPAEYLASTQTKITEFDVTNPAAPQLTNETYLDGYYVDSRETGGSMYIVVQNDVLGALTPPSSPDGSGGATVFASISHNAIDQVLPTFDTKVYGPSGVQEVKGLLSTPAGILGAIPTDDDSLVSILQLDPTNPTPSPVHTVSVFTPWVSTVYASPTNLYLLTPDDTQNDESTTIDKFALGAAGPALVATGDVPGAVFDSYSVDESGPDLRIATSLDQFAADGTDQTSTSVYVLSQQGSSLVVTGMLTSIAPDSSIDTARFVGNYAYLTTFGTGDNTPLMVIDLSNPSAPRLAGTLNDPAATSFLEPIDATHLVGIGRIPGASDANSDQLELTLYDVSNPANPTIVGTTILDDDTQGYAYSEAEYDPHALSYFPEDNALAVPVSRITFNTSGSSGGGGPVPVAAPGGVISEPLIPVNFQITSSLVVLSIDPTSGLTELGSATHTSDVLRSVRIGDVVFSITNYDVQANQLAAGLPPIAGVTIETQNNP
jgi:uncharacterized secreted protein with C-terminal beta-propeller domain